MSSKALSIKLQAYCENLSDEEIEDFSIPKVQLGDQRIMFWGAIGGCGKVYMGKLDDILDSFSYSTFLYQRALPIAKQRCDLSLIFQHDNAPLHRAALTQDFVGLQTFKVLDKSRPKPNRRGLSLNGNEM